MKNRSATRPFRTAAISAALVLIAACQHTPERDAATVRGGGPGEGVVSTVATSPSSSSGVPGKDDGLPREQGVTVEAESADLAEASGSPVVTPEPMAAPATSTLRDERKRTTVAAQPAPPASLGAVGGGMLAARKAGVAQPLRAAPADVDGEAYASIAETGYARVADSPLSTFSIDVDTASYANVRRFLQQGQLPPAGAVRIEELVNYFPYAYPDPTGDAPFSVTTEVSAAPWNPKHQLLHVGLQGKRIETAQLPARNMVFLIDVSGSMESPNKLPLLKRSLMTLTETLRERDRVAIVVYAGASGVVLPATSGDHKSEISAALERLEAGGSTNGGEGLALAYSIAEGLNSPGATTRVILATDGDFNVGQTSEDALTRLIESKRKSGVFLSVLGFGMGNYKDSNLELLADRGNGNYAYVDSLAEARKVLVAEGGATLVTLAQDVKLQLEFNPAKVGSYRLIGYENRRLEARDFNDDQKDAGELGAGHSVTALYELIPPGQESPAASVDPSRYRATPAAAPGHADELCVIKLRYKAPGGERSQLLEQLVGARAVGLEATSPAFRFSAGVAAFGMALRGSAERGTASFALARQLTQGALGVDGAGYQRELIGLIDTAASLAGQPSRQGPLAMP